MSLYYPLFIHVFSADAMKNNHRFPGVPICCPFAVLFHLLNCVKPSGTEAWALFQYKDSYSENWYSHYKDKTVIRRSYLHRNSYPGKMSSCSVNEKCPWFIRPLPDGLYTLYEFVKSLIKHLALDVGKSWHFSLALLYIETSPRIFQKNKSSDIISNYGINNIGRMGPSVLWGKISTNKICINGFNCYCN